MERKGSVAQSRALHSDDFPAIAPSFSDCYPCVVVVVFVTVRVPPRLACVCVCLSALQEFATVGQFAKDLRTLSRDDPMRADRLTKLVTSDQLKKEMTAGSPFAGFQVRVWVSCPALRLTSEVVRCPLILGGWGSAGAAHRLSTNISHGERSG